MSSKIKLGKLSSSKAASKTFVFPNRQSLKDTRLVRYATLDNASHKPDYPAIINRLSAPRRNNTQNSKQIRKSEASINDRSINSYKRGYVISNSNSLNLKSKSIDSNFRDNEKYKGEENRDERFAAIRQQKIERLKDVYTLKYRHHKPQLQHHPAGQRLKAKINSFESLPKGASLQIPGKKLEERLAFHKKQEFHYGSKQQMSERNLPKFLDFCDDRHRKKGHSQDKQSMQYQMPQTLKHDHIIAKVQSINKFPETPALAPVTFSKDRHNPQQLSLQWFFTSYHPHLELFQSVSNLDFTMKKINSAVYFGQINPQNGEMDGKGVLLYQNGKIFEGCFVDGVKQGLGYEQYPDGSFYVGHFARNKRQGRGKFEWSNGEVYDGQWKDNKKTGSGIWKGLDNLSYVGQWQDDSIEGFGVLVEKGVRYEGQFRNFMKWGKGTLRFNNGEVYTGLFKQNLPNGLGDYYWLNKDHYHGEFANGKRHGEGILKYSNGGVYQGMFQNDKKSGQGLQRYQDNLLYEGQFENDLRHGWGVLSCDDKVLFEGFWINNSAVDPKRGKVDTVIEEEPSLMERDTSKNSRVKREQSKISQMRQKHLSKKQSRYILTKNKSKDSKEEYTQPKPFQRACNCERHRQKVLKIQA